MQVTPSDPEEDRKQIAEAVEVAKQADVIVLAIGGNEQTSREAWSLQHMGDRDEPGIDRPAGRTGQGDVRDRQAGGRVPVQRPSACRSTTSAQNVPVIFECWYLGQETGHAVADVLFGDHQPGRQAADHYSAFGGPSAGLLQLQADQRGADICSTTSRRCIAFGYGLSYTTFAIRNVRLDEEATSRANECHPCPGSTSTTPASAKAAEVVQMYIRDLVSSVTRPVKELKGFQKVRSKPGESKTVSTSKSRPSSLAFYDINMKYVVEPGEFEIMVGNSSRDADLQKTTGGQMN